MGRGRKSKGGVKVMARKKVTVELVTREHSGRVVEVYQIMEAIKAEHHTDLLEAKIAIAWRYGKKADADGRLWLGSCKKGSDLDRSLHGFDVVILLNYEAWQTLSLDQRRALMDHELCHATVAKDSNGEAKTDEKGRVVYRTRKHDLEEFREIVARHGQWKDDIRAFVDAALKDKREASDRPLIAAAEKAAAASNGDHKANGSNGAHTTNGNGSAKPAADWRKIALDTMFTGQAATSFREAKIKTLGQLADYTAKGKPLTDIPGIGPQTANRVSEIMADFWRSHPELAEDPAASVPVAGGAK